MVFCVFDGAGPLFGMTGSDQPFSVSSMTSVPSAYPLMAHPAFGLLSPATARPEFGGLGGLGVSAALAAHPQLGAFTEWWRAAEAHGRSHPAFFPPFLGLPPMFAPPLHNHDTNPYTSKTPSKSSQKARKKQVEGSGVSESESGSSLDTDSDGVSSSDIDDLGEEEDDDDEDEDEQSKDSEESDSEKERQKKKKMKIVTPNSGLSKKEKTRLLSAKDFHRGLPGSAPSPPVHLHRSPPPPGLSQSPLLSLSGRARARERPLHTSVIQSTGLAAGAKPLALIGQSRRDLSPKHSPQHHTSSPKNTSATTNFFPSSFPLFFLLQSFLSQDQTFPLQLKKQQNPSKINKKAEALTSSSSSSSSSSPPAVQGVSSSSLPFSHGLLGLGQPNGVIQSTQDVPLALTTKPCSDVPVNLSTGGRKSPASASPTPNRTREPRKSKTPKALEAWRGLSQNHLVQSLVDLFQHSGADQKLPSSKDSDDSAEDEDDEDDDVEDEEDDDEEDSDDSLSESDSNSDSEMNGSEGGKKKRKDGVTEMDTDGEKTPQKLSKGFSHLNSSTNHGLSDCLPLNLQVIKPSSVATPTVVSSSGALTYHSSPSSSYSVGTSPVCASVLYYALLLQCVCCCSSWQRETRMKTVGDRLQGDVAYYAPCGKRLRQYPDVVKYLSRYGITDITRDNFSFSAKIRVGDFYEAREGPQGLQWTLLKEEEVIPHILAMEGRRGRPPNSERQSRGGSEVSGSRRRKGRPPNLGESEFPSPSEAKLLRKLEAQEIARQAAQMKLMRKLEKQALARAAKEARKQQAIMAAEERRKQKEQLKILKQQEKIKRIQQIRMEKELRAQQILEERERRRQHVMLMKAVEARKKAEERERLRQEKRDEKRLNKERKMELRRLELEMIREMKKPNEDMCLTDHKPLPEIPRIHGLVLPGSVFADCLMVVQFLRSFGKVLGMDPSELPTLGILQEGLLNLGNSMGQVQDLLVRLLSSAVSDPGLPQGHRAKSILGDHLTNVGLNRDNVSEVLQLYMEAHCSQTELADLTLSLRTKAFQAHTPAQKAAVLAFLVHELSCSKSVNFCICSCRMKTIYAKRTGKREAITGGEEPQAAGGSAIGHKRKRKAGDSDDDDDEDEDSEDAVDDDEDDEEEEAKKGKKVETCDEVKGFHFELQQQNLIRRKLFESSHALRSMSYGQDRYRRRYWVLPQCGGVYIEGLESGEGVEELEKERERLRNFPVRVKEEPKEEVLQHHQHDEIQGAVKEEVKQEEEKPIDPDNELHPSQSPQCQELPRTPVGAKGLCHTHNGCPATVAMETTSASSPAHSPTTSKLTEASSPSAEHTIPPPLQLGIPAHILQPQTQLLANDQLLKVLSERSGHWFSLLPRSPCDDTSLIQPSAHPQSSPSSNTPSTRPKTPPPPSTSSSHHHLLPLSVKPGGTLIGLPLGNWSGGIISPNLPLCSSPLHMYPSVEGSASPLLAPSVSTSKSGSPVPTGEKLTSASSPMALDLPRNHDHPEPLPIPEGECIISQELKALVNALHSRGIRERALQKQLQKTMELIAQTCNKNREVAVMEVSELDEGQVSVETLQEWCVEEQAMETDIALLQQVEELERKVTSASLQVKGWTYPEPQSEREDLVYYEHKALPKPRPGAESQEERSSEKGLIRRPSNPLDIAVTRLAELERHIERRYLRSPLGTTIQIKLDNVGTVTVPAPAPSTSAGGEGGEEEIAPGMKLWRKALTEVRSSSQLAMCLQQLQKSIAWERSIMKVYCQMCRKGDNEDLLLLCDGCDKGCHTYCHKPKITNIPEGDWYCPACISKASGQSPKSKKTPIRAPPATGGKKATEAAKKSKKQAETCEEEEATSSSNNSTPKKAATTSTQAKKNTCTPPAPKPDSPACVKRAKTARDNNRDLGLCRILLAELERHQDAWPFLTPVNLKSVPGYRKVIKKPMDFSTIREKLVSSQYQNLETFIIDVNLVFDNCEKFNEDNSDIGRAGHNMRKFFEKRWTELLKQTN
uniref:Bromodomain adjacent to zinc finger domain, 2Ba n=1 Tax=Cyprinus carpio carpio TaxID=630221 RepID=A0A8C1CI77_CYPCA